MKIDVLGTKYTIKDDPEVIKFNADGCCKEYSKCIDIAPVESMLDEYATEAEKESRYKRVMRHELIHAFFNEAGLRDYSDNEFLVDWLACQFPKMQKAFEQAGCN